MIAAACYGSDAIAQMLRALDLRYVALNPGASYRGLHDSLVNVLGDRDPHMLLCLHEEHAIAIAHGYAKVTGRPMGAIVHSNVGLMHATMAIYNAWCDRVPVIVLGATGPVDAAKRRPWIDWIHTARDQGALVRDYTKWDDQPASIPAALESLARAYRIATTAPNGPVYVCFDAALQEAPLEQEAEIPVRERCTPPVFGPAPDGIAELAAMLREARAPVILAGRVSRDREAWRRRVALAERLGARVLTDLKVGAAFPTDHPLHAAPPSFFLGERARETLREADVILALEWLDLGGTLRAAFGHDVTARIASIGLDETLHRGWNMEYQALAPVDRAIACDPDVAVTALFDVLGPSSVAPSASVLQQATHENGAGASAQLIAAARA